MREKKKGFTLIELLAIIFIISILFGISSYFIINSINKSKEESENLTYDNIKSTARIYTEENPKDVIWQQSQENKNQTYSCISIKTLVSKGLLKNNILENNNLTGFVIIKKDKNGNFISEELDTTGICQNSNNTITIPTNKEYCNNLTYNGTEQTLTKDIINKHFEFTNNMERNAGTYEVKAKLSEGYIWEDGTFTDKTITCSIKKAIPTLILNPNGTDNSLIELKKDITTELTSNIDGTITIKPANKDYITAIPTDNSKNVTANTPKEITITPQASRNIETTITITLTPTDTKNYYSTSTIYTIGQPSKIKIPIPTANTYCNNLSYNKNTQTLVKPASTGFNFYNITGLEVGSYDITAKLKYGYIWEDDSLTDKIITCTIKEATPTITYQTNGGTTCNPNTKTVTYNKPYGELCTPSKTENIFLGWYTAKTNGTQVTPDTLVSIIENHSLYAKWKEYHYLVDDKTYTTTFQEAIGVASNNSTIKLVNNYTDTVNATVNKNITFNTNGLTWTRTETTTINSGSTLTVTGTGTINKLYNSGKISGSDSLFINKGTLNISYSGTIKYETNEDTSTSSGINATINNYGTATITNGTFSNKNTRNISNNEKATLTMNGGSITTNGGRAIHNNGTLTIENVTINTTNARAIQNEGSGTITIKGSNTTVKATDARAIQNNGTGTINIEGGTLDTKKITTASRVIVNASSGTINIKGGTISGTVERPVQNDSSGTINISGGTITSTNSNTVYNNSNGKIIFSGGTLRASGAQTIYNNNTGSITMSGGTITSSGTGIYNNNGTVSVSNGNITTTSSRIIQNNGAGTVTINGGNFLSKSARGIQNESNGTININGGTITSEGGSTIYNLASGTIKITNGTLTAKTNSKPVCVYNYGTGTIYISGGRMTATYLTSAGTGAKKAYYNKNTAGRISVSGGTFDPTP